MAGDISRFTVEYLGQRPPISSIVDKFMGRVSKRGGYVQVIGSGPGSMDSDLRNAVARVEERDGLKYYWDSRE